MALDPPITQAEEEIVALMRILSDKQTQVVAARTQAETEAETERQALITAANVRTQIVTRMQAEGIVNPDTLLRGERR